MRILTGAMLPAGADAVVPVEDTDAPPGVADLPETVAIRARGCRRRQHPARRQRPAPGRPAAASPASRVSPAAVAVIVAAGHGAVARPSPAARRGPGHRRRAGRGRRAARPGPDPRQQRAGPRGPGARVGRGGATPGHRAATSLADVERRLRRGDGLGRRGRRQRRRVGRCPRRRQGPPSSASASSTCGGWPIQPGKPLAFGRAVGARGRPRASSSGCPATRSSSFVTFELFVRPVLRRLAGDRDPLGARRRPRTPGRGDDQGAGPARLPARGRWSRIRDGRRLAGA